MGRCEGGKGGGNGREEDGRSNKPPKSNIIKREKHVQASDQVLNGILVPARSLQICQSIAPRGRFYEDIKPALIGPRGSSHDVMTLVTLAFRGGGGCGDKPKMDEKEERKREMYAMGRKLKKCSTFISFIRD